MSGKELKRHDFTAVVAGELPLRMPKVFYVVEYVDLLTELEARSAIDEVLDETRRGLEAREEYRRESRLDEQAASEVRLAATNNIITERIMVSGRRLYSVGVIQREGEAAENKRFFESFRLLPRRAAP